MISGMSRDQAGALFGAWLASVGAVGVELVAANTNSERLRLAGVILAAVAACGLLYAFCKDYAVNSIRGRRTPKKKGGS